MTEIILHGCNGKMGRMVTKIVAEDGDAVIVAGVDKYEGADNGYPVYERLGDCDAKADVVIDFSDSSAADGLLEYCETRKIPLVLCTTGLSDAQVGKVRSVSEKIAVLRSANMSLGINMLLDILKEAAGILYPAGFDVEIVEKHHNQKKDAPSGTALALADAVDGALGLGHRYTYDRSTERRARERAEIGISSVRGGTVVGEHDVIFAGEDEVIEFRHTAYSKAVFAKGAVEAGKFLKGRSPGLFDMNDVIRYRRDHIGNEGTF